MHGDHRGRELGYPTANLSQDHEGLVPADGVYAGWLLRLDLAPDAPDRSLPAAISVGTNPTFDGHQRRVEAYVLDRTDLDLYGERVVVEFVDRLRPTLRFDVDRGARRPDGSGRGPVSRDPLGHRPVLTPAGAAGSRARTSWLRLDLGLFIGAAGLSLVGVVLVWSATRQTHGGGLALKQLLAVAIGMACAVGLTRLDVRIVRALAPVVYVLAVIGLVAVVSPAGLDGQRLAVVDPAARRLHPAALRADEGRARHRARHAPGRASRSGTAPAAS